MANKNNKEKPYNGGVDWSSHFHYDDGKLFFKEREESSDTPKGFISRWNKCHAGRMTGYLDNSGYLRTRFETKLYQVHRIIWEMHNGPIPEGMTIDHIDRNRVNNKIENLRIAYRFQNRANTAKLKGDLPKGVSRNCKGFQATIVFKGKRYCLGTYATPVEASKVYIAEGRRLLGEFFCES